MRARGPGGVVGIEENVREPVNLSLRRTSWLGSSHPHQLWWVVVTLTLLVMLAVSIFLPLVPVERNETTTQRLVEYEQRLRKKEEELNRGLEQMNKEKERWRLATNVTYEEEIGIVDVVYTFVDPMDPEWRAAFLWHKDHFQAATNESIALGRFRDRGLLRASLRSLETHGVWRYVRHVFIVSTGHVPKWLNTSSPHITIVPHKAIFPDPTHLPTFNSLAIELHLHRIPGLLDHYLYFNDDVLLMSTSVLQDFYRPCRFMERIRHQGTLCGRILYLSNWFVTPMNVSDGIDDIWRRSMRYTRELLLREFPEDTRPFRPNRHSPVLFSKPIVQELERMFKKEWVQTSAQRFRDSAGLYLGFLFNNYLIRRNYKLVIPDSERMEGYIPVGAMDPKAMDRYIEQLHAPTRKWVVVNDVDGAYADLQETNEALHAHLNKWFPTPSIFEKRPKGWKSGEAVPIDSA